MPRPLLYWLHAMAYSEPEFFNFEGSQESILRKKIPPVVCSLAGRYDNPIPTRFLDPIDCSKSPALVGRYDNPIPTRFLAPIDCLNRLHAVAYLAKMNSSAVGTKFGRAI
jgi:hypothetical protein